MSVKITKHDTKFRQLLLRKQNYTCQRCETVYPPTECRGLHVSHYYSRANWIVRVDFNNADLHCCGCHQHLGGNPHLFKEWKKQRMGEQAYDALVLKAGSTFQTYYGMKKKFWIDDWYEWAKKTLKQVEAMEEQGITDFSFIDNP